MVSLPSKWLRKNHLIKGDGVEVEEKTNKLILSSKKIFSGKKEITIKITKENEHNLKNILTHIYRKGFDVIIIEDIDSELLKKVRKITTDLLLGFEITKRESKQCVVENISEPIEQKYQVMLKKTFLLIQEMQNLILEDFLQEKFNNKNEIEEIKNQQDKFILFCRRLLIKEQSNNLLEWELLTFLMHIQHSYYYLYEYVEANKIKKNNIIIKSLKDLQNYFSLFYDSYYNKNMESINKINHLKNKYQFGEVLKLIETSKTKDAVIFSYIREIFRLIQIGTSPILGEILESNQDQSSISA